LGNQPPEAGIRVPPNALREFVQKLFVGGGMRDADALTMAELLVATDLRGVVSHGTWQTLGYVRMMREGRVNPQPEIQVVTSRGATRVYDGDGGMGHLPSIQAARFIATAAREQGLAAATTGNHFHFGGAGKYSRMAAAEGCIGIAVSSHRWPRQGMILHAANGASPMSIAFPARDQPPLVLDMATSFVGWSEEDFERVPFLYFKQLGLGAAAHAIGGILAGIWNADRIPPASQWESNQGGFFAAFAVDAFMDEEEFLTQMDRFVRECRAADPFPGHTQAELPGNVEARLEIEYTRDGIPVSDEHREALETTAAEVGVESPLAEYDHTRFQESPTS
jgi:L-2-hydroxycarboxylate dehydrogenase (NAD+)